MPMLTDPPKLRTCLWFHDRAAEAAGFYVGLIPDSRVDAVTEMGGGAPSMCGWLTDRYGVSWQIVPRRLLELQEGPAAEAVRQAMYKMQKIEIAALEEAAATTIQGGS